jgi:hypothetical protein
VIVASTMGGQSVGMVLLYAFLFNFDPSSAYIVPFLVDYKKMALTTVHLHWSLPAIPFSRLTVTLAARAGL